MEESTSDSIEANQELAVAFQADKKMWLGGMLDCFANALTFFGGPYLKKEPEEPWEIPSEMIENLNFLGSGAQGVVFSARMKGEMVAVKKVREKSEINVKYLKKLNHENIVHFKGVCTMTPYYGIVMEYCQYGSLFEFLHSGSNLLPGQLMKWARDVALGMAYLHQHNIVHRDLKSPNVLIGDNLTVKVSDFGTSRHWDNVSTVMSFTGTVAWMSPEIIRHERCTERVDVWSFGVVLWEILTREMPYKNLESHAIMWGVGTDTLSLPIPSGCPNSLQVLMCQCWQRVANNRPPFKIIAAHIEMAAVDIAAIDSETFAARQVAWGAEVRDTLERIYARNEEAIISGASGSSAAVVEAPPKFREDLRHVKQLYEQQIIRANELFLEVCTVRLQLEQREKAIAEREKMLKACRCGQRKNIKIQRQQSSTSSDGKPVMNKQPRKKKSEALLLVNYVEKDNDRTHSVAVHDCACDNETKFNNNVESKKETIIERNGNIAVQMAPVHKKKISKPLDNAVPDIAQV